MTNYEVLMNNLDTLKLDKIRSYLPEYLDKIAKENVNLSESLLKLTSEQIEYENDKASCNLVKVAAFPYIKTLDDFDFDFQPSVNKNEIYDLATLRFLENKMNILFVGNSGVGKTHLAISIAIEVTKHRRKVYFVSCHDLITRLNKAYKENRLDRQIAHFAQYEILIIDEIGYLPIDKNGANLFFQLIAKRYNKKSTIITTNVPFSRWGEVFNDMTLANAILDRLLHQSYVIKITGNSYRIKDKLDNDKRNTSRC